VSHETDLEALLKPLVGNRVTANTFAQVVTPIWPAIRYTFSNTPLVDSLGDGDDETSERSVQLDVVAVNDSQARALRLSVMAAMRTFDPPAILDNDFSTFDDETKTHRKILQYTFHGSTS
jgi:hypothetical protein